MPTCPGPTDLCNLDSLHCRAEYPERSQENKLTWEMNNSDDDMCQIDKDDFIVGEVQPSSSLMAVNFKVTAFMSLLLDFVMSTSEIRNYLFTFILFSLEFQPHM